MIQNNYLKLIFSSIIGIMLMLVSCTDNFESMNTNPNEYTDEDVSRDYLIVGGLISSMQMDVVPVSDVDANEYQRAQNLSGDIFSGYMAAIGEWNSGSNNSTYNLYFDKWNDVAFDVAFKRIVGPSIKVKEKAEELNLEIANPLVDIIKIASLHRITDLYGPIPYSKAGQGALGSSYDSQESVYKAFFVDLNKAIDELTVTYTGDPTSKPFKKYDLIYGSDFKKWIIFANSLKLRLAMRISYVEPGLAKQYAEEAVNNAIGVMTVNEDNALLKSGLGIQVYNPLEVCWNRYSDCRMGASMDSYLNGYEDPRTDKYFTKSAKTEKYSGVRNGLPITNKAPYISMSTPAVFDKDPVIWMVASEMYFLRAEGVLRGWNMAGNDGLATAEELYNMGIKTSFEQTGVSSKYEIYVNNNTAVPANFMDYAAGNSAAALSDITIKWDNNASFEKKLERIITQKWLAIYPNGQEAWSEFRRTGYPKIFPIVQNYSSGTINTATQVRRLPFPQAEYDANEEEVLKAISLLGGADNGGTKLWWDKK